MGFICSGVSVGVVNGFSQSPTLSPISNSLLFSSLVPFLSACDADILRTFCGQSLDSLFRCFRLVSSILRFADSEFHVSNLGNWILPERDWSQPDSIMAAANPAEETYRSIQSIVTPFATPSCKWRFAHDHSLANLPTTKSGSH